MGIRETKWYSWLVLDIIKAYNRVAREVLWDQMREVGYGGKMLRLIQRLYDENGGSFRLGGIQCSRMGRSNGLRVGCILSPFLFVIYIRKAEERLVKSVLGYRDRSDNSDANLCRWYAMWEVGHWVVTVVRDYLAGIREVRVRNQEKYMVFPVEDSGVGGCGCGCGGWKSSGRGLIYRVSYMGWRWLMLTIE